MRATKLETHNYIAAHIAELAKLAIASGLTDLAYLLSMALLEAESQALAEMKRRRSSLPIQDNKSRSEMLVASAP